MGEHGACDSMAAAAAHQPAGTRFLLLSQLRPLLADSRHSIDETSLSFRSEDGALVRFKKMKHLLQAVLRWREQRQAWRLATGSKCSAVDMAVSRDLALVPSRKHNDLMLCCQSTALVAPVGPHSSILNVSLSDYDGKAAEEASDVVSTRASDEDDEEKIDSSVSTPRSCQPEPQFPADLFDDPFEPPPELSMWARLPPRSLCRTPSDAGSLDFCAGVFVSSASSCTSGQMTPIPTMAQGAV